MRTAGPAPTKRPAPVGSPHPRLRDRRVEVARRVGRRRRRRLNVILALVATVVWSLVGLRSGLLDVDRVQVAGADRTAPASIRDAAGIALGSPMVEADLDRAARAVSALPWVDEVRIQRLWPGTVRVVVTERTALAAVPVAEGWARVDAKGRVLDVVARRGDLVTLAGRRSVGPGDTLTGTDRSVLATLSRLPSDLRPMVEGATSDDRGLVLAVGDGWTVVVGSGDALVAKAAAARAVRAASDPADGCVIDVRVPDAPVLTPGGSCG